MVKFMLVFIGAIVVVLVAVYYFGGFGSFDPTADGKAARTAITPGMTWQQVINVSKPPAKWTRMLESTVQGMTAVRATPEQKFDEADLKQKLADSKLPYGFTFVYRYSAEIQFQVHFDGQGKSQGTSDLPKITDLMIQ